MIALLFIAMMAQAQPAQDAAKLAFDRARQTAGAEERTRLLKESLALFPTFEAAYQLGHGLLQLDRCGEAGESFRNAFRLAGGKPGQALGLAGLADAARCQHKLLQAAEWFRASLALNASEAVSDALRQVENELGATVVPAAEIAGALTAQRGVAVRPRVNLRVEFKSDSTEFSQHGLDQAREIGRALVSLGLDVRFRLIGHTDLRGDATYNMKLSLARAQATKTYLVRTFKIAESMVAVEGRGLTEPLRDRISAEDDAVNRRVEIQVE